MLCYQQTPSAGARRGFSLCSVCFADRNTLQLLAITWRSIMEVEGRTIGVMQLLSIVASAASRVDSEMDVLCVTFKLYRLGKTYRKLFCTTDAKACLFNFTVRFFNVCDTHHMHSKLISK